MADEVREQVEGFGIKGGSFSAMFYWAKSTKEGESYFIQIRLGPDVFTFVEVVKCKKSGRVELVKVQPSLRMEAPGGGGQTQKPVQVPIPSPDPCLLGLGPCP